MNPKIRFEKPFQLPCEANPTTVEVLTSQANTNNQYPYWNILADGFVEGFKIPFVALFGVLGIAGCDSKGRPLIDSDAPSIIQDAQADAGNKAVDAKGDVKNDVPGNYDVADVSIVNDVAPSPDSISIDVNSPDIDVVAEDILLKDVVIQDVGADLTDTVTVGELPQDVGVDVVDIMDAGICQYFCDVPIPDVPKDVVPTGLVYSKTCSDLTGAKTLFAPLNSMAVACTNGVINPMVKGGAGCVAECGFFDDNVILSTNPNTPVAFSTSLFVPPEVSKKNYTIKLTFHAPVLSNGTNSILPGFMDNSFVFAFDQKLYNTVGEIVWIAEDKDTSGKLKGAVQMHYQPYDFFFKNPETLDVVYVDAVGKKVAYRYPCDQLPNPIIQCTDVKPNPAPSFWETVPEGQAFCTSNTPVYNTLLPASGQTYFASMCLYLDTVEVISIVKDSQGKKKIVNKIVPLTVDLFNVDFNNAADVALKKEMTISAKFGALVPKGSLLPVEPQFASGNNEITFQLAPDVDLTWDATWLAVDSLGHVISARYNPEVKADPKNPNDSMPAYLSISYLKGAGLFAKYTFPCVLPNASAPVDYSKKYGDYVKCPNKMTNP